MNNKSIQSRIFKRLQPVLTSGETVLIAVSGGADSLALLHIMRAIRDRLGIEIHVATLDHGLRGEQGADDARYVEQLAAEWDTLCTRGSVNVNALMEQWKVGVETAARRVRYDFLANVMRTIGASRVLTAHHADDQAETVLMRLLRGTSIEGLIGMQFQARVPYHPALWLWRPLLDMTKAELIAYCAEAGIIPREDATNIDTAYHRNRIRHEVLPYLRTLNPQVDRALIQLADIALHEDALVQQTFANFLASENIQPRNGRITISHRRFQTLQTALQRRFIIWAAHQIEPDIELNFERVLAALNLIQRYWDGESTVGAVELLGSKVRVRMDYNVLVIEGETAPIKESFPLLDSASDTRPLEQLKPLNNGWSLRFSPTPPNGFPALTTLHVPADATLKLRTRIDGDTMRPVRLHGHSRKISHWMIDQKIPAAIRDRIPILTVNDQIAAILWLPNPQIDIAFAPTDDKPANLGLWFEKTDDD